LQMMNHIYLQLEKLGRLDREQVKRRFLEKSDKELILS